MRIQTNTDLQRVLSNSPRNIVIFGVWRLFATKIWYTPSTRTPMRQKYLNTSRDSGMSSQRNCTSGILSMVSATFYVVTHRWLTRPLGELRTLFGQSEAHADYLDRFFLKHNLPFVSWIHDLEKEKFHSTAETLLAESDNAGELTAKEVMEQSVPLRRGLTRNCSSC